MHLVGFIIRIFHDAQSLERQIIRDLLFDNKISHSDLFDLITFHQFKILSKSISFSVDF